MGVVVKMQEEVVEEVEMQEVEMQEVVVVEEVVVVNPWTPNRNSTTCCSPTGGAVPLNLPHLLLGPQLVEHLLDLQLPVVLQRVERRRQHLEEPRLLDGGELVQDGAEGGPGMRVRAPAL